MLNNIGYSQPYAYDENNRFIVPGLCVYPSLVCNSKCKLCVVKSPQYTGEHLQEKYVLDSLKKYFQIVDFTRRIDLVGGEPLIAPILSKILHCLYEYNGKFGKLRIVTNGTILPRLEVIEALSLFEVDKIEFLVSNYPFSKNTEKLTEKITELGIRTIVRDYSSDTPYADGWVDYGDFSTEKNNNSDCIQKFQNLQLYNGVIYRCNLQIMYNVFIGSQLKYQDCLSLIEDFDNDTIDTYRNKLLELMEKENMGICRLCSGKSGESKRFKPAEQFSAEELKMLRLGGTKYNES